MSDRTDECVTTIEDEPPIDKRASHVIHALAIAADAFDLLGQQMNRTMAIDTIGLVKSLAADAAETASLREETQTLRDLLREAECVIFEGVREDAPDVTGCESWYEVRLDSDEVRWRILDALGMKPIGYERFLTRIGAKEKAEVERDAAVADRDRLAKALDLIGHGWDGDEFNDPADLVEKYASIALDALAGREGSDDA